MTLFISASFSVETCARPGWHARALHLLLELDVRCHRHQTKLPACAGTFGSFTRKSPAACPAGSNARLTYRSPAVRLCVLWSLRRIATEPTSDARPAILRSK